MKEITLAILDKFNSESICWCAFWMVFILCVSNCTVEKYEIEKNHEITLIKMEYAQEAKTQKEKTNGNF